MWNRQREATEAEEQLRKTAENDTDGYVKLGPAAAE
jgi:ATP-binding cassette subfamily B protein